MPEIGKFKNNLKYWRLKFSVDQKQEYKQREFAKLLKVTQQQLSTWETHDREPTLDSLMKIWVKLRHYYPQLNLQDLIQYDDSDWDWSSK